MARPLKDGVDYFPFDIDFFEDDKVRLLRTEYGAKGMYILIYILSDIYKNGYYISWSKDKCLLVSDGAGCGCTSRFIQEFIQGCVKRSFFNKRVFDMFGILTSAGIQRRYIRMLNNRDEIRFVEEYFLLDITDKKDIPEKISNKLVLKSISKKEDKIKSTENSVKNTGNPQSKVVKSTGNSQSKVKESKEKESKEKCVYVMEIPCKDGTFYLDEDFYNELTHTYTKIDVKKSLNNIRYFMLKNSARRRTLKEMKEYYINRWLSEDEENSKNKNGGDNNDGQHNKNSFGEESKFKGLKFL